MIKKIILWILAILVVLLLTILYLNSIDDDKHFEKPRKGVVKDPDNTGIAANIAKKDKKIKCREKEHNWFIYSKRHVYENPNDLKLSKKQRIWFHFKDEDKTIVIIDSLRID